MLVGWEENDGGERHGVVWVDGVPSKIENEKGEWLGEASSVSHDGSTIAGKRLRPPGALRRGWRRSATSSTLEYVDPISADAATATALCDVARRQRHGGLSGNPFFSFSRAPFLWTREMGTVSLDEFVRRQGTAWSSTSAWRTPFAMSDRRHRDHRLGTGIPVLRELGPEDQERLRLPRGGGLDDSQTMSVAFPGTFDDHLSHGDTVGPCPDQSE